MSIDIELKPISHLLHWYQDGYVYNQDGVETYGPTEIAEDNETEYIWTPANAIRIAYVAELVSAIYPLSTILSFNSLTVTIKAKGIINQTPCRCVSSGDNIPGRIQNGYYLPTGSTYPYLESPGEYLPDNVTHTRVVTWNRNEKDDRDWLVSDLTSLGVMFELRSCASETSPWDANKAIIYFLKLEVNITLKPVVTTEAVSSLGIDHAKGNGTADEESTERGFEIKLSFSGTLYQYIEHSIAGFSTGGVSLVLTTWVGTIIKIVTDTGTFAAGAFIDDLGRFPIAVFSDKLFEAETYNYRAYAIIDGTTYYGDWVEFTTNHYPSGQGPDDQIPIIDIVQSDPVAVTVDELPAIGLPEFEFPDFEYPEIPPYDGSWIGWFYYRKAFTKKDLDELRKKCRRFQDNSVEYALVLNHNSRVLQQFLNSMTDYMGADEYNTFRPIIPAQHLNELARKPLNIMGFKRIINSFVNNSIDNAGNVNNNFHLIREGLSDYVYTEDEGFTDISVTTKIVVDNNPDAERLKKVVDRLNREMANNYMTITHNLHVLRAILI